MPNFIQQHKLLSLAGLVLVIVAGLVVFEVLVVLYNGKPVPTPTITRQPVELGKGAPLNYLVLGDSTAVAQGADYQDGIAMATARHLALNHQVRLVNAGVSGARINDVGEQLTQAEVAKPDVVLIAVGANDVTHLTSLTSLKATLNTVIDALTAKNCDVKIIVTGAPEMGAVVRFPQPIKALAGRRTKQVNAVFAQVALQNSVDFAQVANATGDSFKRDPSLFASDKFHPNARGYATWVPVINQTLDKALAQQPPHCDGE